MSLKLNKLLTGLRNAGGVKMLVLGLLVLGLPIGLYLVSKPTRVETPAEIYQASVSFSPASATLPPDRTFTISTNPGTASLAFAKVVFNFDKTYYKLESEITGTNSMPTVVRKTSRADANASGRAEIVVAVPPGTPLPTGSFALANFTLGLVNDANPANSNLTFTPELMQMIGPNSEVFSVSTTNASLLMPAASPTPSPTGIPTPTPTLGPELLQNTGFESNLTGWEEPATANTQVSVVSGNDKALYVANIPDSPDALIRKTQWIPVRPGTSYYFGAAVKVKQIVGEGIKVMAEEYNGDTRISGQTLTYTNTSEFEPKSGYLTTASGTTRIALSLFAYDGSEAWFDDFYLFEANTSLNLVTNPGFQLDTTLPIAGWEDPTWADIPEYVSVADITASFATGTKGLKVTASAYNGEKVRKTQWINVSPNSRYQFAGSAKVGRRNGLGVRVLAEEYNGSTYITGHHLDFANASAFETKSDTFITAANTTRVAFSVMTYDYSIGYYDNLSLKIW